MAGKYDKIIRWVRLTEVPEIVYRETGYRPGIQAVRNWAKRGHLRIARYKPLRTTKPWVLMFLRDHYRVSYA